MGREARCIARWGSAHGEIAVSLEGDMLIARGAFRAAAARSELSEARVDGDILHLKAGATKISLHLGFGVAERWLRAIETPPPTLAQKLGIGSTTRVTVDGRIEDPGLIEALADGAIEGDGAPLIIARITSIEALAAVFGRQEAAIRAGAPIWLLYTKGRGAVPGEAAVRDFMRAHGCIDTKVAAVSARLTGSRFITR